MNCRDPWRRALTTCVAAAMLSGCGGALDSTMQHGTVVRGAANGRSWMSAGVRDKDLLYVADLNGREVYVFTYPKGNLVGTLYGLDPTQGLCSDKRGNVWVTTYEGPYGTGTLVEFAHGGTTPIATLADPYGRPDACAVDPQSGNLVAANPCDEYSCQGNVVVYRGGSGTPTEFSTSPVWGAYDVTYDDSGNIFVAGYERYQDHKLAWLSSGGASFQEFNLKPRNQAARGVAWDGTYLLIGQGPHFHRFKLLDGYGVRVDTIPARFNYRAYLVQGSRLVSAGGSSVSIFDYPAGVSPIKTIAVPGNNALGVTVSVAPH